MPGNCQFFAWAEDVSTCLQSLIRFDVCSHDTPVGVSESFDVNFGAESDRSVLLFNRRSLGYDNRLLRDHPDPEKSTSGQLLNGSFKFDLRRLICGESRESYSDSHNKCERGQFHSEESSISRLLAATLLVKARKSPRNARWNDGRDLRRIGSGGKGFCAASVLDIDSGTQSSPA